MGLANSLNISELLRRLGVKGDSLGSAPLLESLRLTLNIGDLSDLVPPVGVPMGAGSIPSTSGVATNNKWSFQCRSAGGATVERIEAPTGDYDVWITDGSPFGAVLDFTAHNFAFQQEVVGQFNRHLQAAKVSPAFTFRFGGTFPSILVRGFPNWVGPGQFMNIEAAGQNASQRITLFWTEYPAGLNP